MWRRVNNLVNSLLTYQALSPDIQIRQRVNRKLSERPSLSADEWFESFWQAENISKATIEFVYDYLTQYSGIEFACVVPQDRLEDDLHWTQVCWFDWEMALCDDIEHKFGFDLSDRLEVRQFLTVADLVAFLDEQIRRETCLR